MINKHIVLHKPGTSPRYSTVEYGRKLIQIRTIRKSMPALEISKMEIIIPITVPKKPIMGAAPDMVAKILIRKQGVVEYIMEF